MKVELSVLNMILVHSLSPPHLQTTELQWTRMGRKMLYWTSQKPDYLDTNTVPSPAMHAFLSSHIYILTLFSQLFFLSPFITPLLVLILI